MLWLRLHRVLRRVEFAICDVADWCYTRYLQHKQSQEGE